jgi:3-hydroxybutyryl-CoA dehydrogenase
MAQSPTAPATIGILGSGIMAGGIAELAAASGHRVVIRARTLAGAEATITGVAARLDRAVAKGRLESDARDTVLAGLSATEHLADLADCDLVIESVVEDLEVKRHLFAELDHHTKPGAILTSNTSTLPIVELAMATGRPERVCGFHFFNPATAMRLVEVVRPITASDETITTVTDLATAWGHRVVEVADRAGFVVNALLFPYLNSAIAMAERGTASIDDIDAAMRGGCGFPMGPFELLDLVGLDTSLSILEALHREFGDPSALPHPWLRRLVAAGHLGRKTGRGFRTHG